MSGFQNQTVNAGVATAIAFTTLPTTADPGQEAGPITIQVLNGGAGVVGEVVNLSTDSLTGTFYDANGNIITSVITGGGGNASFFYMDTSPGSPNLTATDSAKPAITATQTETVSTAGVALERGGQMNVLYSTITGAAVKIQQSQPDGGLSNNLVAATGVATVNPNTPILAAITTPGSNPPSKYIPVMSTATLTVAAANFDFNGGAAFGKIDDVEATIDIQFPTMQTLSIVLIPPTGSGLAPITLVINGVDDNGNTIPGNAGVAPGANMGVLTGGPNNSVIHNVGTVFDQDAPRGQSGNFDNTSSAPWIGHFRPESGSLNEFDGLTPTALEGTWMLQVTDFTNQGTSEADLGAITGFSLHFSSLVSTSGFGAGADAGTGDPTTYTERGKSQTVSLPGALTGSPSNIYPTALGGAAGTPGASPGFVAAVDNTLGSFSPYQGRFYIAYTTGTNVFLIHSDNDGSSNSWSNGLRGNPVQVNDDSITDNFSEGNRPEFMPSLTIDPVTGTVVVDYYDARYDASGARRGHLHRLQRRRRRQLQRLGAHEPGTDRHRRHHRRHGRCHADPRQRHGGLDVRLRRPPGVGGL